MAKFTLPQFIRRLESQQRSAGDVIRTAINRTTRILRKQVIEKHFTTGPRARSVNKQSGKLQKSIRFSRAVPEGKGFAATMTISAKYATTHVAKNRRSKKTIRGKRGPLAIPLEAARTATGVPIAPPLDPRWKPTHIVNDIIFGQSGGQEVPLFFLTSAVRVPQRISAFRDIVKPGEAILKQQLVEEIKKIL